MDNSRKTIVVLLSFFAVGLFIPSTQAGTMSTPTSCPGWYDNLSGPTQIAEEQGNDSVVVKSPGDDGYQTQDWEYYLWTSHGVFASNSLESNDWEKVVADRNDGVKGGVHTVVKRNGYYWTVAGDAHWNKTVRRSKYPDTFDTSLPGVQSSPVYNWFGTGTLFFNEREKKWYYITEQPTRGRDSDKIVYGTAPADSWKDWTYCGVLLNPPYPAGDPSIIKMGNKYYMAVDNNAHGGWGSASAYASYCINMWASGDITSGWKDKGPVVYGSMGYQDPDIFYSDKTGKAYIFCHSMTRTTHLQRVSSAVKKKPKPPIVEVVAALITAVVAGLVAYKYKKR